NRQEFPIYGYRPGLITLWHTPGATSGTFGVLRNERLDRFDDVRGVNLRGSQHLLRLAGTGHIANRQMPDDRVRRARLREDLAHRIAEAAFGPVVFHDNQPAAALGRRRFQSRLVYRLHGVEVNNANGGTFSLQGLIRLERL